MAGGPHAEQGHGRGLSEEVARQRDAERGWGAKPQRGSPGAAEKKRPWLGPLRGEESHSAVPGGLAAPPTTPRRAPRGPRSNNVFDRLAGRVQAIIVLSGVKRIDPVRNMSGAMGPACQLPAPLALGSPLRLL